MVTTCATLLLVIATTRRSILGTNYDVWIATAPLGAGILLVMGVFYASIDMSRMRGTVELFLSDGASPEGNILRVYERGILFKVAGTREVRFVTWDHITSLTTS